MEVLTVVAIVLVIFLAVWPFIRRKPAYGTEWREHRRDIDKLPPITEHEGVDTHDVNEPYLEPPSGFIEEKNTVRVNVRDLTTEDAEKLVNMFGSNTRSRCAEWQLSREPGSGEV